ncbi:protein-L-isoaspartate O-methyltransferase family protein [Rhizorhapis suberifaciens]|uniref:Protein-L-isoaspartate O-methyltransferase n=1 Tax=Rhizorhapis suberifaciens TaxID=13656 RepID=A0A840HXW6_9SPHN|nr:protein-L-isoaspartate O-methyltransferase [Rhizorhapis suberifaciens]MBB4642400.1 protein-L-isoaspartate(D-aspartate) O-methyltransferase [Rhizorhapis suberifaciens]
MTEHNFKSMRTAMVESQLRTSDVNDPRVIAAMANVAREAFLPNDRQALAYIDRPVKLTEGRWLNPPLATGRLLTAASIAPDDNVLLIGAATGYTAALLSQLAASVVAVEEDEALLPRAKAVLAGYGNVKLVSAALNQGSKKYAPYSLIVIDGAVEEIPSALVKQVGDGGRLVAAVLDRGVARLAIGRKSGQAFGMTHFADCESVPLPGFEKPKSFTF